MGLGELDHALFAVVLMEAKAKEVRDTKVSMARALFVAKPKKADRRDHTDDIAFADLELVGETFAKSDAGKLGRMGWFEAQKTLVLAQAVTQEGFKVGGLGDIDAFEAHSDALSSSGDHDFAKDDGGDATDLGIAQEFLLNALVVTEVHPITKQDGVGVGSDRFGDEFLLKAVHDGEDDC